MTLRRCLGVRYLAALGLTALQRRVPPGPGSRPDGWAKNRTSRDSLIINDLLPNSALCYLERARH